MIIENWFSTPILYYDIEKSLVDKIQNEIDFAIPEIVKGDLSNPWEDTVETSFKYDEDCVNNIADYSLVSLEKEIIKSANKILPDYNLKVFQSWINFSHKGNFQFDHSHTGKNDTLVSGTYYYKTNGEDGDIEFSNPVRCEPMFGNRVVKYKPKIGRLILFPAWLIHKVHINKTESVRISISFNLKA
jgi:uncharacterized protein (TIGR02466 family)